MMSPWWGSIATGPPTPDLEYGVFAESGFGFADTYGTIYTDDEDGGSNGYDVDSRWAVAAKKIVGEGHNTTLRTVRRATLSCPGWTVQWRGDCLELSRRLWLLWG